MGNACLKKNKIKNNDDKQIENKKFKTIIDWTSNKKTCKYHWWPMKHSGFNDPVNNLFAREGGLDKYDKLFRTKSVEYQKLNYYRSNNSNSSDANWAGFCDKASILSSLYEYPKYPVTVIYDNKSEIFYLSDIEALMIIASDNSIKNNISLFFGNRNNYDGFDELIEPNPCDLIDMLNILTSQNEPFVMDIDKGQSVWNYSYDKVIVNQYDECGIDCDIDLRGNIKFYNFIFASTGYPDHKMDIWGYIHNYKEIVKYNSIYNINEDKIQIKEENHSKSEWISKEHPDFLWKKFGIKKNWKGECKINPKINAELVYLIYQHSIDESLVNIPLVL